MIRGKCVFLYLLCILAGFSLTACHNSQEKKEEWLMIEAEKTTESTEKSIAVQEENICIYLCGEVKRPDVYEFPKGARVKDAVEAANGFTKKADQNSINLARLLVDGEQIVVPEKGKIQINEKSASGIVDDTNKLDINTATKEQLMELTGVGEAKAEAILTYREKKGRFQSIEEIKEIRGIKDGVFQKFKDLITVH